MASPNFDCDDVDLDTSRYSCTEEQNSVSSNPSESQDPEEGDSDDGDGEGSNGGLSSSAKIGLGVGIGVGIPLLTILAFFLWRRNNKRRTTRSPRNLGAEVYSKDRLASDGFSAQRNSNVPSELRPEEAARPTSSLISHRASASVDRGVQSHEGARMHFSELEEQQGERFEMEEQQRPRHEMDARSLPDLDAVDDDGAETRSLQDIEESRANGPVSPVGR